MKQFYLTFHSLSLISFASQESLPYSLPLYFDGSPKIILTIFYLIKARQ